MSIRRRVGPSGLEPGDLKVIAPMALRLRRSKFMTEYFGSQQGEEEEMDHLLTNLGVPKHRPAESVHRKSSPKHH